MWSRSIFAQRFTRGLHRDENNCRKNDGIFKDEEKKGTEKQSSIFYRPIQDLFHSSSHPARSADSERVASPQRADDESTLDEARVNNVWQVFDRWLLLGETTSAVLFKVRSSFVYLTHVFYCSIDHRVSREIRSAFAGWSMRGCRKATSSRFTYLKMILENY